MAWEGLPWDQRLLALTELSASERGRLNTLILALPVGDRETAVPKLRDVAVASLQERLAQAQAEAAATAAAAAQAGLVDTSPQWACEMTHVESAEQLPEDAEAVRAFLSRPPPKQLPVFSQKYHHLACDTLAAALVPVLLIVGLHQVELLAEFQCALYSELGDASEMTAVATFLPFYTDRLLLLLSRLTGHLQLSASRNVADKSGTTSGATRPDCSVWHNNALLYKGEDKVPRTGSLADARAELGDKMARNWNILTMGSLPYIVCYANCSYQLQYYVIMRNTNIALPVSQVFDLRQFKDRIQALCTGVNVFRLMRLLSSRTGDVQLPLGRKLERPSGVTITVKMHSVVKRIANFAQQPNVNPNVAVLKKVYDAALTSEHLVHAVAGPQLAGLKYSVELMPLGYHSKPRSEVDLRAALKAVLQALVTLHQHGFVHRDLRWHNILRSIQGAWFLADLESAAEKDQEPGFFRSTSWTNNTLVDGKYTTASDVEQAGQLMQSYPELSPIAQELAGSLVCEVASLRYSAAQALQHRWFVV